MKKIFTYVLIGLMIIAILLLEFKEFIPIDLTLEKVPFGKYIIGGIVIYFIWARGRGLASDLQKGYQGGEGENTGGDVIDRPLDEREYKQISNEILKVQNLFQNKNEIVVRFSGLLSGLFALVGSSFFILIAIGSFFSKNMPVFSVFTIISISSLLSIFLFFRRKKHWLTQDGLFVSNKLFGENEIIDLKKTSLSIEKHLVKVHDMPYLHVTGIFKENDCTIKTLHFEFSLDNFENGTNSLYEKKITLGSVLLFIEQKQGAIN